RISDPVLKVLKNCSLPGNVRELKNLVENLLVRSQGNEIGLSALPIDLVLNARANHPEAIKRPFKSAVSALQAALINSALDVNGGNRLRAAGFLGIHRNSLRVLMKSLKIWKPKGASVKLSRKPNR